MTLDAHQRLVRRGTLLSCWVLAAALVAQMVFGTDFSGLPFIGFGIVVGGLGSTLLARLLWERLPNRRA